MRPSAAEIVRSIPCDCMTLGGRPCGVLGLRYQPELPEHDHVWRWKRALRDKLITQAQYDAAVKLSSDGHRVFTNSL